jgi:hypothetical protein
LRNNDLAGGAWRLPDPEYLPALEYLDLSENQLGPNFVLQNFVRLVYLNLSICDLGPNWSFPNLPHLQVLKVGDNNFGPWFSIWKLPNLNNLTELDIGYNELGTKCVFPYLPRLKILNIDCNNLDHTFKLSNVQNLTSLSISNNDLGPNFDLKNITNLYYLESLEISCCKLGPDWQFPEPSFIPNLTFLNFFYSNRVKCNTKIPYNIIKSKYPYRGCMFEQINNNRIVNDLFPSIIELLKLVEPDWSYSDFDILPNELICHIIGLTKFPMCIAHVCRLFYWCTYTTTTAQTRTGDIDRRALLHLHIPRVKERPAP